MNYVIWRRCKRQKQWEGRWQTQRMMLQGKQSREQKMHGVLLGTKPKTSKTMSSTRPRNLRTPLPETLKTTNYLNYFFIKSDLTNKPPLCTLQQFFNRRMNCLLILFFIYFFFYFLFFGFIFQEWVVGGSGSRNLSFGQVFEATPCLVFVVLVQFCSWFFQK